MEFLKQEKWQFLILLVIIGGLYLLLWRNEAPQIAGDTKEYREAAADLVENWTYTDFHYRPPGLPILIAITGATEKLTFSFFFSQMFFHIASVFILVTLALHLKFPRKYIYIFLALALFPPFVDSLTTAIMSESFAAFLLTVALFFLVKNNSIYSILACGLFLSMASLVRPVYQLVFVPQGLLHFLFYRSFKHVAFLSAGSLLLVGAYVVFNWSHFNVREVTLSGMNLSTRTSLVLERLPEDNPMRNALLKCRDSSCSNTIHLIQQPCISGVAGKIYKSNFTLVNPSSEKE